MIRSLIISIFFNLNTQLPGKLQATQTCIFYIIKFYKYFCRASL